MPLVEATLVSAHAQEPGLGEAIEQAQIQIIERTYAEGLHDPEILKSRLRAAREEIVATWP
jgi:hypothetical protein